MAGFTTLPAPMAPPWDCSANPEARRKARQWMNLSPNLRSKAKNRMLAFLKTIFRGRTAAPQGAEGLAIPRTVYTPGNTGFARRAKPSATPRPPAVPLAEPNHAPQESDANGAVGSDVDISLQAVLKGLPHDLQDRVRDLDIRGAT